MVLEVATGKLCGSCFRCKKECGQQTLPLKVNVSSLIPYHQGLRRTAVTDCCMQVIYSDPKFCIVCPTIMIQRELWWYYVSLCFAARLTHRTSAEAFDGWCSYLEERKHTRHHLQKALAFWSKASLITSWQAWQDFVLHAQQRHDIICRALQHFLYRTQAAAFRQWVGVVLRKKEGQAKASTCLKRLLNSRLSAAFQGWHGAVSELQAKHLRLQKAAAHFLNQRLAICFLTWRAASEEALLGAAKLDHAVGHWLHGTVAKVFNAWKEWAHFKAYSKPIVTSETALCCTPS